MICFGLFAQNDPVCDDIQKGHWVAPFEQVNIPSTMDGKIQKAFIPDNAEVLPGDADFPESGTWEWANSTTSNSVVITPSNMTLNVTSTLGARPLTFTHTATDAKGNFTATVLSKLVWCFLSEREE